NILSIIEKAENDSAIITNQSLELHLTPGEENSSESNTIIEDHIAQIKERLLDLQKIPESVETTLNRALLLARLAKFKIKDYENQTIVNLLENCLGHLKQNLEIEWTSNISKELNNASANLVACDWAKLIGNFKRILREISPFDIQETLRLINKTESSAKIIKNKDIVLLLGPTGSGKSTTIHFLAKSKIKKVTVDGLQHYEPEVAPGSNERLESVKTSPYPVSETRYINAIPITYDDSGIEKSMLLCDTPGFGETAGVEVDVANGYGLVNALQHAKSVKSLILISKTSTGARLTGLRELLNTLSRMLPGIGEHYLESFDYAFTQYNKSESKNINAELKALYKDTKEKQTDDDAFTVFLENMIRKTRQGALIIDLDRDTPEELLDTIKDIRPIPEPGEVFQFFVAGKAADALSNQLKKHEIAVINAIEREDYPVINFKVNELKQLNQFLNRDDIKNTIEICTKALEQHVHHLYEELEEKLQRCFTDSNDLTTIDLEYYQQNVKRIEEIERFIPSIQVISSATFKHVLMKYLQKLFNNIIENNQIQDNSENINYSILAIRFNKLMIISQQIPEFADYCQNIMNFFLDQW
ncbi:MAG: hypothetical protein ACK4PR_12075, partial [Gammaproteobacteria bacterium]